jgi:DNA-binding PadR family transcriptional regulator
MSRLSPDEVLLGLLQARPAHGYDLLERFRDPAHLGRIWNMSVSQLYAVLKRLEAEGAITGHEVPQPDAPPRTKYVITPLGEQQVADWLAETQPPISIHRIRVQFLSRLYIATLLGLPTEGVIDRQLAVCESQRDVIREKLNQTDSSVETLTLEFVQGQLDAAITWLYHCREHPLALPGSYSSTSQAKSE